jgi:hypothetical protein
MNHVFHILVIFFASINLLLTWPALLGLPQPTTLHLWMLKVFTSAISPILLITGLKFGIVGLIISSAPAVFLGGLSAFVFLIHIINKTGLSRQ